MHWPRVLCCIINILLYVRDVTVLDFIRYYKKQLFFYTVFDFYFKIIKVGNSLHINIHSDSSIHTTFIKTNARHPWQTSRYFYYFNFLHLHHIKILPAPPHKSLHDFLLTIFISLTSFYIIFILLHFLT